ALAVMPNRGKRVVQQEIAETPTGTLPGGLFATGTGCGALNIQGNAATGSYNSSTESSPSYPPTNQVNSGGDVGSNGNISLGGSSAAVNGNISTALAATVGSCPGNGISKSGGATYTAATGAAPVYTAPVPPAPNPLPPQTSVTKKDLTLPAGSYGNVTIKGTVTLTGGTDINHPAVYTINSLTLNGGATLNITGPVVINLAGQNLASSSTPVLDMNGGSFSNTSYLARVRCSELTGLNARSFATLNEGRLVATPSQTPDKSNRAVIAFADGRRMRGYIFDFSAIKDSFRLSPEEDPLQKKGAEVKMKDLKAVFFVRDFNGNRGYQESQAVEGQRHGRRLEV